VLFHANQQRMVMTHQPLSECNILSEDRSNHSDIWIGVRSQRRFNTLLSLLHLGKDMGSKTRERMLQYLIETIGNARHQYTTSVMRPMTHRVDILMEYLSMIRPLLYVSLIMHYGKTSWKPWMTTVCLETLLALHTLKRIDGYTLLEKKEQMYRLWSLAYNLLRSPFYDMVTKPQLLALCDTWKKTRFLSWLANMTRDYMPLWEDVYFYTARS
jgi:peroxin-16